MKNKVLVFIIGVLVGAIISSIVFYVYIKSNSNSNSNQEFIRGERREMFENFENGGTPPEMPDGEFPNMSEENGEIPSDMKKGNNSERKDKSEKSSQEKLENNNSTNETI